MGKPVNRLGRGLGALIPQRTSGGTLGDPAHALNALASLDRSTAVASEAGQVQQIDVESIRPNPRQPRTSFQDASLQELAASIRNNGILQPVLARAAQDGKYELVAGERRWRAAKLAGLKTVPAIVRELSDAESFELALVENLQREDLGPLERAAAYQHYLDAFGGSIEDLARRLAESRANVSNYLRLLKLRPEICYMLGAGELGMGQARAIAGLADPQRALAIAKLAARRNLSVRQVEELVRRAAAPASGGDGDTADPAIKEGHSSGGVGMGGDEVPGGSRQHLSELGSALGKAIGLRVHIKPGRRKNSGRVIIRYGSLEEFDRLAERLGCRTQLD
ncbi:MAG: ParB/RepB/Spo0J family partition protein [Planctomycetota bacterium]